MSKRYCVQRFLSTLQLLKYQWNITSKEIFKLGNIKTTYNKSFKLKLKVIKLTSERQLKKLTHNIYTLKTEQKARGFVKN